MAAEQNRGPTIEAVAILGMVLAWFGTLLRVYVKIFIMNIFGVEDWLLVLSLITYSAAQSILFVTIHHGVGKHMYNMTETEIAVASKYWYHFQWMYLLSTTTIKAAIGACYLRLMMERWQKLTILTVVIPNLIIGIAYCAVVIFQCIPLGEVIARFDGRKAKCIDPKIMLACSYVQSVLSTIGDWILGLLPLALIVNSHMQRKAKACFGGLILLGILASVSTLVRIAYLHKLLHGSDFYYEIADVAIWGSLEQPLALLALGLGVSRPLFRDLYERSSGVRMRLPSRTKSMRPSVDSGKAFIIHHTVPDTDRNIYVRTDWMTETAPMTEDIGYKDRW